MNVLIIKLTSMGDLIHVLPAVTDAVKAIPNVRFDWVVDETFSDIPRLHSAIETVMTTGHRRWRREKWKIFKEGELVQLWRDIRKKKYDAVIDAQGNIKSAAIMCIARGVHYGMDKYSVRERFAHLASDVVFSISPKQHAIVRQRQLFANALNYSLPHTSPDFGISKDQLFSLPLALPTPYLVFVHSTTWPTKHWPESYWKELILIANRAGYHVVLPWGTENERVQSECLAQSSPQVTVLPRLSILKQASVLYNSSGAICVDTGLGHLAAALNKRSVHIYGPTDPSLIGATGNNQLHLAASYECSPCYLHKCKFGKESMCFVRNMVPGKVWGRFLSLLS